MLRMNKNNEYEIDRELTGKLAIESNAELQDRVEELEEENRKLKKELEQTIYWKVDYEKSYKQADAKKDELLEEIRKLKEAATMYRNDCKKLRAENEYLHSLLPEADGYIIEKQMEKRLWNDGEEDVYEDWGE